MCRVFGVWFSESESKNNFLLIYDMVVSFIYSAILSVNFHIFHGARACVRVIYIPTNTFRNKNILKKKLFIFMIEK